MWWKILNQLKLFIVGLSIIATSSYAATQQPPTTLTIPDKMTITSNTAKFYRDNNKGVFRGDVLLTQSSGNTLTADQMTVFVDAAHQLNKVVAVGDPANYHIAATKDKPETIATAETMQYFREKQIIILSGNAQVTQGENIFKGPYIIYDLAKKIVTTKPINNQRTTIIIKDDKNNSSTSLFSGPNS